MDGTAEGGWVDSPGNPTVVAGCFADTWLEVLRSDRVMLSRSSSLLRPPPTSARHFAVSQVRWLSVSMAAGHHELAARDLLHAGVETDLSSSEDTLLTIPRPLRREIPSTRSKFSGAVHGLRPWGRARLLLVRAGHGPA